MSFDDLLADAEDLLLILLPTRNSAALEKFLPRLRAACPEKLWLGANMPRGGADRRRLQELRFMAKAQGVRLLAQNDALYAQPEDRALQDVLSCVRERMTLAQAGRRLESNAERHLKAPQEMARLFADAPEAIERNPALSCARKISICANSPMNIPTSRRRKAGRRKPGWRN